MKILITGAAKRLGRMLTEHLAAQGHQVAIHFNSSAQDANELLESLPNSESHTVIKANLSDLKEAENLIAELSNKWGKPDAVINNASTYHRRGMTNFSNEELLDDYNVNFFSPLIIMREFKNHCRQGKIINFLDRRVDHIEPEAGPYALAKKSLRDATLACAEEWDPEIQINAVAPGPVLLPDEDFKSGKKQEALENINSCIDKYLSTPLSGIVTIIE